MNDNEYRIAAMQALHYDEHTGKFTWKIKTHGMGGALLPGDNAGCPHPHGYWLVGYAGKQYRAHRLAYLFMTGEWPAKGMDIDHINGVRDDNRWCNLRLATRSQNNANGGVRCDSKSGVRGVSWQKKHQKWDVRITVNKKTYTFGLYADLAEAIAIRRKAEQDLCADWTPAEQRLARPRGK